MSEMTTTVDLLKELASRCKASVSVTINDHRDYYQSAADRIAELRDRELFDASQDIVDKMIETDTIICVHFYPNSPVGFDLVYHYDLELALREALAIFEA